MYPPVDTDFFTPADDAGAAAAPHALIVSALVPYKRIEIAIDACRRARVPLTVVGDGPERARLETYAAGDATFLGRQSDEALRGWYRRTSVTLLPGEEDFGIVPLEAQACGRPVVALGRGGARETIVPDETGVLVEEMDADAFAEGLRRALARRFDAGAIRAHAERFSRARFGDEMEMLIRDGQ